MQVDKCKIDVENLNELIGLCEDKMVSPFKKKKPEDFPGEAFHRPRVTPWGIFRLIGFLFSMASFGIW